MPKWLHRAILIALIPVSLLVVAYCAYGVIPHSWRGWAAFIFLGLPLLVVAEGAGEWFRRSRLFGLSSAPVRIAFGVIAGCALIALAWYPLRALIALMQS